MNQEKMQKNSKKTTYWELLQTYKSLLIIPFLLFFIFVRPQPTGFLANLLDKLKFLLLTFIWASLGILVGGLLLTIFRSKGQLIITNNSEFLEFCQRSNGLLFFGSIGSGKTALLAMLAQELPSENKYATFPCHLPWAEKAQIDFSYAPSQSLGVTETIFIDEGNLLFQGNIVQEVRERQRFLSHFVALSRQQGTRIFGTYQRVGQAPIQMREVVTGLFQVKLLQRIAEGIYVQLIYWEGVAWTTNKTEQEFTVFIPQKYLDTYNSYWLKSLKYLRSKQGYI